MYYIIYYYYIFFFNLDIQLGYYCVSVLCIHQLFVAILILFYDSYLFYFEYCYTQLYAIVYRLYYKRL